MNENLEPCRHQDLKVTATTIRSIDIELLNVDPNPCGHQISQQEKEAMDTSVIGIIIQDKVVIIVKSMDISQRITLRHTSMETTTDG